MKTKLALWMAGMLLIAAAPISLPAVAGDGPGTAYLFAHMIKEDYGRLYYSVSTDALHWTTLNGGKRLFDDYRGHPDIAKGHDGRFYLIGNREHRPEITLWVSDDLITWHKLRDFSPDIYKTPDFKPAIDYKGAPKILYDTDSARYLITWHSTLLPPIKEDTEQFWRGMRTLYVTSKDLKTFTDPKRLFDFDIATIDTIFRKEGPRYYAFIKDEKYPDFTWPTGKTIRVCSADNLLGPYSEPSPPITPNFHEAPTLIRRPDKKGWYLYYEQYPAVSYGLATAPTLAGPWHNIYWQNYQAPKNARHGAIIQITKTQYDNLLAAYSNEQQASRKD